MRMNAYPDAIPRAKRVRLGASVLGGLVLYASVCTAAQNELTADRVVSAIEGTFGVTPGQRRNHTKGSCASGHFVGTPEAAALSRSALFSGRPLPVIARFSLAGGNPKVADTTKNARGMALEFTLPDGKVHHITMLNTPVFGAAHPRTFFDQIVGTALLAAIIAGFGTQVALVVELRRPGKPTVEKKIKHDGKDAYHNVTFLVRMDEAGTQSMTVAARQVEAGHRQAVHRGLQHRLLPLARRTPDARADRDDAGQIPQGYPVRLLDLSGFDPDGRPRSIREGRAVQ